MSYTSESQLPPGTNVKRVLEVVRLLGFREVEDGLRIPNRIGSFIWYEQKDYKSWVGVELSVYRENGTVTVSTRSRLGRSYWDLSHQNKTLKLLRDLFGGHFTTDAGRNRYWHPEEPPPSSIASGCYLARWRFQNALTRAEIYLSTRELRGNIAKDATTGVSFMDQTNPRLLSNNLLVPYIIAVWEEYFRSTFAAAVSSVDSREAVLNKANISQANLERIATGEIPIEQAISECFSFQRPSIIGKNFDLIDRRIDIGTALKRPYRNRKTTLYDSIERLVEGRNDFVHAGNMNLALYDKELRKTLNDIVIAADRAYEALGAYFNFDPIKDY